MRVYEGGAPPYRPTSDPTVYLRTGNVTTPLRQADADIVGYLYAKRAEAAAVQAQNLKRAQARLDAVVARQAAEAAQQGEATLPPAKTQELTIQNLRLLTAYLQPFYPRDELAQPWRIESKLADLRLPDGASHYFPERQLQPVADGLLWAQATTQYRLFACHQVYADGLVHAAENTDMPGQERGQDLHLDQIARLLYLVLRFSGRLYASLGYSGLVRGGVRLANTQGRRVQRIVIPTNRAFYFPADMPVTIDREYHWLLEADTHQLTDGDWLHDYFKQRMRRIYWDLGYSDVRDEVLEYVVRGLSAS